ncbi:MAG: hypothetical protein JSS68_14100 [Actinobacteria bacterium]|nr:hypothetical protein [Actinomycetota bacterium]
MRDRAPPGARHRDRTVDRRPDPAPDLTPDGIGIAVTAVLPGMRLEYVVHKETVRRRPKVVPPSAAETPLPILGGLTLAEAGGRRADPAILGRDPFLDGGDHPPT